MRRDNLRIDRDRFLGRLFELAGIGATGDGGVRRLALSAEDGLARARFAAFARHSGLEVKSDRIGNQIALLPGVTDGPAVLIGSHIDTVATGGKYDGALGVMAGLEVLTSLKAAGHTPKRTMAVIAFTNEEGARFQPDMMGACVWAGLMSVDEARAVRDADGVRLGDALDAIDSASDLEPGAIPAHAYLELHIEQGPVLHAEGAAMAAVTGVQAITWLEAEIAGEPNHGGTTPMAWRRDAAYVAAELMVAARATTRVVPGQLANTGRIVVEPGNVNVVAKRATLTFDLRNPDDRLNDEAEALIRVRAVELAAAERVAVTFRDLARFPSVRFDARIVDKIEAAAAARGIAARRMPSGAGHDAQIMAGLCPTAMIFVPSRDGKSHTPEEHTDIEDLVAGAEVLLAVALDLAEE